MATTRLRVLHLVPALVLFGAGATTPEMKVKCGGAPMPGGKPLTFIDGVISPPNDSVKIEPHDVYSIDVICMNPKDSTFNRTTGVGVVSIWTKQGPAPRVAAALDVIRDAQDAHVAKAGRYIIALEEIRIPERMKMVRITMDADRSGWIARTTLPRLLQTCTMFDGAVAERHGDERRRARCANDP